MTVHLNSLKGVAFVRAAIALAAARNGSPQVAAATAAMRWGEQSAPAIILRGAVTPGTLAGGMGDGLSTVSQAALEFTEAVRNQSVVGRLQGLRRVPLAIRYAAQTSKPSSYWVGEAKPKPVTRFSTATDTLPPLKIASLCPVTDAMLKHSDPGSEEFIRRALTESVAEGMDAAFLDPDNNGTPDVSPASITAGIAPVTVVGSDLEGALVDMFDAFEGDLGRAFFIAKPTTFVRFSSAINQAVGARGGELKGIPALASKSAPEGCLILADPGLILYGAGGIEIRTSKNTSIEMADSGLTQDGAAGTGAQLVSMLQSNLTAILTEQECNWQALPGAVALMAGIGATGT